MQVNQLQHELSKKDELLRIVSIASEESETDSSCSTPLRFNESFSLSQGLLQLDMLQEKLKELEEENMALRSKVRTHFPTNTHFPLPLDLGPCSAEVKYGITKDLLLIFQFGGDSQSVCICLSLILRSHSLTSR